MPINYNKPQNNREVIIRKELRKKINSLNAKMTRRDIKERAYSVIQQGINDSKYEVQRSTKNFKQLYTEGYGVYRYNKLTGRKEFKKQVFGKEAVREYLKIKSKSVEPDYRLKAYSKNYINGMRKIGISEKQIKQVRDLFKQIKSDDELTYLLGRTELPDISYVYAGEYSDDDRGKEIVNNITNALANKENSFKTWKKQHSEAIKSTTQSIKDIRKSKSYHIEIRGRKQVKVYNKVKEERNW